MQTDRDQTQPDQTRESSVVVSPVTSRFLYVDIAALRAKQLRRGALPRFATVDADPGRDRLHKPERIAMEEVRRGLVPYDLPPLKPRPEQGA